MNIRITTASFCVLFLAILAFAGGADAQIGGGAIAAIDEPVGFGGAAATRGGGRAETAAARSRTTRRRAPQSSASAGRPRKRTAEGTVAIVSKPKKWDGFLVGDKYTFLNFEVVSAVKPYHTRDAKANGAKGLVQVEVQIDENGNVLTARARTGNKLLHPEAERAAFESKFNKPTVYGKPARAMGFLVYRFGSEED